MCITLADTPARDTTGDGLLNDINDDGEFDIFDAQEFFGHLAAADSHAQYFNFDGDIPVAVGAVELQLLFEMLQEQT